MSWFKKDQETQERDEVPPMPRGLTSEEIEAQKRREGLTRASLEDEDLPWYSR